MFNPYTNQDFFGFFVVLAQRIFQFFSFKGIELVSDEKQLLCLALLSLSSALVGTFLVLRKMTMLANALSHTVLLGIVVALLLPYLFFGKEDFYHVLSLKELFIASLFSGLLTTFLTEGLHKKMGVQKEASIGLVFSVLFALGITLVTLFSRNLHVGTELIMGNIDAVQMQDIASLSWILGLNAALFILFFRGYTITTFDSAYARSSGFSPSFYSYLVMIQTSLTAVGGFRAVGVLLILAFLVIPPMIARFFTNRLKNLIGISMAISVAVSFISVALSRHMLTYAGFGLSTGALIATLLSLLYLLSACIVDSGKNLTFSPTRKPRD